ncbi:MAG TPA: hypothetical protein VMU06_13020 [Stellaceae bacterium]|nr:hypothetical protein [Stellaceae bacterium]
MWVLGGDIGQAHDPTAAAVVEAEAERFTVRHLERLPLGTPYPIVADRLGVIFDALPGSRALVIDATGVGRPVLDLLRAAGRNPVGVSITGGKTARRDPETGIVSVPKTVLLAPLLGAVEAGRLSLMPGLPEAEALGRELAAFRRKVNKHGHTVTGGKGVHDDLVVALALAILWTSRHGDTQAVGV